MQRAFPANAPISTPSTRAGAALREYVRRLTDPATRTEMLWSLLWWPFVVWSDAPAPTLPGKSPPVPKDIGLAGAAVVNGIDRVRSRMWITFGLATIFRALWLGIAIAACLMLIDVLGGPVFDPRLAIGVCVTLFLIGCVLATLRRPTRMATAQMLDRTFGLQERLGTALDDLGLGVPKPGERAPVVYLQMADAANAIAALRQHRRLRPSIPVREIVLVVLASLILATLSFLRGLGGELPPLEDARVPRFTPAVERLESTTPSEAEVAAAEAAPTVQQVLERSDRSMRARRDLQALAEALADHAVTRSAAEEIARGNYAEAGEQLRQTANRADELSPAAREALAGDLDQAAGTMQPETNGLEEATRNASSGLRAGDEQARSGMRELGDAVERAGQDVIPQDELASQMRSAQQSQNQGGGRPTQSSTSSSMLGDFSAPAQFGQSSDAAPQQGAQESTASDQASQSGNQPGSEAAGNLSQANQGQPESAGMPGGAEQAGAGQNAQAGDAPRGSADVAGANSQSDSAEAQQGAGAGTGSANEEGPRSAAAGDTGVTGGEAPAAPNVSTGDGAEAEPSVLQAPAESVALPTGPGQQGMQTSSGGGASQRGSGAGVTAGSGFAVQGDVGEAGPDSNRVPPQHRETVERYFSNGSGE